MTRSDDSRAIPGRDLAGSGPDEWKYEGVMDYIAPKQYDREMGDYFPQNWNTIGHPNFMSYWDHRKYSWQTIESGDHWIQNYGWWSKTGDG